MFNGGFEKKRMEIDEKWTRDEKIVFLLLY